MLAGSLRHPMHVVECALAGAHVGTMPWKVLESLFQHPLTDKGLSQFRRIGKRQDKVDTRGYEGSFGPKITVLLASGRSWTSSGEARRTALFKELRVTRPRVWREHGGMPARYRVGHNPFSTGPDESPCECRSHCLPAGTEPHPSANESDRFLDRVRNELAGGGQG